MAITEERIGRVAEQFQLAGLGELPWEEAVAEMAALTGSMAGELIGLGANAAVSFNLITGFGPEVSQAFVAAGGGDPMINSRVRIGSSIAVGELRDEADFTTADDVKRHGAYGEWIRQHDFANVCLTPLVRDDNLLIGLAAVRSSRQGNIGADEKKAFAALAAHARMAVRTQLMLQQQSLATAAGILDALGASVFVCDAAGRVLALSVAAERLASEGTRLRLVHGQIVPVEASAQAALHAAIAATARERAPGNGPIVLRDAEGGGALLVETSPVPRSHPIGLGVAVLVIVRESSDDRLRAAEAARALFGLTPAEAAVAAQLVHGRTVAAIAEAADISIGTVRTHVKRIFDKAGVHSQIELVSLLARFR